MHDGVFVIFSLFSSDPWEILSSIDKSVEELNQSQENHTEGDQVLTNGTDEEKNQPQQNGQKKSKQMSKTISDLSDRFSVCTLLDTNNQQSRTKEISK